MEKLKLSIITVAYNAEDHIERCIRSVLSQQYDNIEYIVIDGKSTDGTVSIISNFLNQIACFISEKDNGIYDAMNKGIRLATGDVIGILNADDLFADQMVISNLAELFANSKADIVYGDLDFIDSGGNVIRKWRSGQYRSSKLNLGWMPPHPTFYCRRQLFESIGGYSLDYGSAADYELMLRFLLKKFQVSYLERVLIKMEVGGVSNSSLGNRFKALGYDLKAMRNNKLPFPFITILLKPLGKVRQFF